MFYAIHTVHDTIGDDSNVYAFKTRRARDQFVKYGPRHSWSLVFPYEQKPIAAAQAKKAARRDSYGDAYAIDGDAGAGVIYF